MRRMDRDSLTAATQRVYDAIARRNPSLAFLNYGYDDPSAPADEMDEQEVFAASQRLYNAVLDGLPNGAAVLEVGCGRGAGAAHLLGTRDIRSYVGLDLSPEHIRLCRHRLADQPKAHFAVADARRLPVPSSAFDAAYTIEAAQHFEDRPQFYGEVARALRPGGRLFLASIWRVGEVEPPDTMTARGLRIVSQDDITPHVVRSLARSSVVRRRIVESLALPDHLTPVLMSFVGAPGGENYDAFVSGRLVYHRFVLEKT